MTTEFDKMLKESDQRGEEEVAEKAEGKLL